jgi:transcriptional regulator with XRE-family HTH domain
MAESFKSVAEMVSAISGDKNFSQSIEKELRKRRIATNLFALRNRFGLSQKELAQKIGITQSKISKIENSYDLDFSISDIVKFCSALNMGLEIGFIDKRATKVEMVKYHFSQLLRRLEELREMAKGDRTMEDGVRQFHFEAFANIVPRMFDCLNKVMPKKAEGEAIHVSSPTTLNDLKKPIEV